jgi:hypothetical protein
MTHKQLSLVVPMTRITATVKSLITHGFVDHDNESLTCASAAYPAIREYLADSGFPVDTL